MTGRPKNRHRLHVTLAGVALAVAVLGLLETGCARDTLPHGPHPVIIIDIDTLRADHLGCYGYQRATSPNMDQFAKEAVQFEWAFSQAPNTPPSQTSILTGLYPSTHGMIHDDDRVPDDAVTLAEALRGAGWSTAAFVDGGYMSAAFNINQGFDLYDDNKGGGLAKSGPKALTWLDEHRNETFLLLVHTYDTHTPYAAPPPFGSAFTGEVAPPDPGFAPTPEQMEAIRRSKYTGTPRKLAPNDLAYAMACYDGEIRYVDDWFGHFMEKVRALGLDRRAIIVVISDHGEEFQEHGSVLHEKLYSTVTHVPLMIRLPKGVRAERIGDVVETIDLMPTLLELGAVPVPEGVQGVSLVPLMRGEHSARRRVAFSESPFFGTRRSLVIGKYQLLHTVTSGSWEVYDYRSDPTEQHDLAATKPDAVAVGKSLLQGWNQMIADSRPAHGAPAKPLDSTTREQLRSLGYLGD